MTDAGDMRQLLGELKAAVTTLHEQMARFEVKLDCIDRKVTQHRTGWQIFMWIGGAGIALVALLAAFWGNR